MVDARYMYTAGIPAHRVGALVARARVASSLTDRTLADRLRVRLRTVRDWERGQIVPSDDQIEAIATACGHPGARSCCRAGESLTYDADDGRHCASATGRPRCRRRCARTTTSSSPSSPSSASSAGVRPDRERLRPRRRSGRAGRGARSRRRGARGTPDAGRRAEPAPGGRGPGPAPAAAPDGRCGRHDRRHRSASPPTGRSRPARVHVSAGDGGRVVRGDPFVRPTTVVSVAPDLTASSTITIATAPSATTAATMPAATTAVGSPLPPPTPAPTLPAVVLAAEVEPPVGQDAGPDRHARRRVRKWSRPPPIPAIR